MEKKGFLLDADYITENGKPVIRLWCKSKEGENFIVLDNNFEPYFYVLADEKDSEGGLFELSVRKEVSEIKSEIEEISIEEGEWIRVKRVEETMKKLLGVPYSVLKIFTEHPKHVPLLREEIRKKGFKVLEADVLFIIRYLVDKQLRFFDGIKVEGEKIELPYIAKRWNDKAEGVHLKEAILAKKLSYKRMEELPKLRILAFDCEMASPYGMPSPKKDPVMIISVAYSDEKEDEPKTRSVASDAYKTKLFMSRRLETGLQKQSFDAQIQMEGKESEDEFVISNFLSFIEEFQPDIIAGYNSDAFDWQYLRERTKINKIRLSVGADGSTPQYERGVLPEVNIMGRLNVDLYRIAKRNLDSVKVKTLENVAEYLGVMRREERINLTPREIYEIWNSDSPSEREKLHEYAKADAISTLGIASKVLPQQIELSKIIGYPLDEVTKMGRGRQVEAFLFAEASKAEELAPPKRGTDETYEGGFVLLPEEGLHEDVVSLDFSSMYPTIMISFNISPDTFFEPSTGSEAPELFIAPEVGHAFLKKPEGFFKRILKDLKGRRARIKEEMKKHEKDTKEYRILDMQQQSIKILMNSFYGYTGWGRARFYRRECAEATTAWGRFFIRKAIKMSEEKGLHVIYSDTDSLFVKLRFEPEVPVAKEKGKVLEKAKEIAENISKVLPLELEIENLYETIFFTGKKKRYAGVTADGEMVIKGLEVKRGDWCELAKEVQSKVLEYIIREKSLEGAVGYVRGIIKKLKEGEIALDKLTVHKTLTRRINAYKVKQAHIIAAERAFASNVAYEVGSKIPYVIIKGVGKTSDRAFPVDVIERSNGNEIFAEGRRYQIDSSYYIEHQVIPVVHRILQPFGYDISSFEDIKQKTFAHWLG